MPSSESPVIVAPAKAVKRENDTDIHRDGDTRVMNAAVAGAPGGGTGALPFLPIVEWRAFAEAVFCAKPKKERTGGGTPFSRVIGCRPLGRFGLPAIADLNLPHSRKSFEERVD